MTKKNAAKQLPKVERKGRVQTACNDPSLTQQQFKASVDVNNIVNHYKNTGIDPYESRKQRVRFGDAASQSFQQAMYHCAEVNSAFASLPAQIRSDFANDPERWLLSLEGGSEGSPEITPPEPPEAVSADPDAPASPSDDV